MLIGRFLRDSAARTTSASPGYWQRTSESQAGRIWCGFAFERVCFAHVEQMKRALGISGVVADVYAWRHRAEGEGDRGAQVDLVIDRRDDVVNLCEMKYSRGPFAISADYARRLLERSETFLADRRGNTTVFLTMVTPAGVKDNEHAGAVQAQITLDDLFRDA